MPNRRPFPGIRFLVLVFAACVLSPPVRASHPCNAADTGFESQDDMTVLSLMRLARMEAAIA